MEIKKSKKADLEKTKGTGLLLGYILALAGLFTAFEWTTHEYEIKGPVKYAAVAPMEEEIETIPEEEQLNTAPSPVEDITPPEVFEVINIVEDNVQVETKEIQSSEETNTAVAGPVTHSSGPAVAGPVMVGEESDENEIFEVVESMPEFPGGEQALMQYLTKNLKYPASAQDNNIQGRVIVTFVVNRDGSIVDPKIMKSLDAACDKEAVRVIKSMPKWKPGKQRGKAVRVKYTLPVLFRLQ